MAHSVLHVRCCVCASQFALSLSMSAIPPISLQLCMHFLDAPSLLRMARCCRGWMHAARDPFSWASCTLRLPVVTVENLPLALPPLLAHVSLALVRAPDHSATLHVDALLRWPLLPRVRELNFGRCEIATANCSKLARALSQLQTFSCVVTDERLCETICSLPQLRSLRLHLRLFRLVETSFARLEDSPHLTSLTLADDIAESILPIVGKLRLSKLRHFGIICPLLYSGSFLPFCTSTLMRGVRSLRLDQYCRGFVDLGYLDDVPVDEDEWAAGFAALKQLQEISFTRVSGVDWILPHLVHAPALTRVQLDFDWQRDAFALPTAAALQAMLDARADIRCRMHVRVTESSKLAKQAVSLQREMQQRFDDPRFRCVIDEKECV